MDLSRYTALVVDDFATTRRIVSSVLRDAGFARTKEAQDGVEALRQLAAVPCHFIVSDWNMPNMNGLELLKTVRSTPHLAHLPFLLLTAEAQKENIVYAAQAGADGYLVKPFSAAMLNQKIETILKRKAAVLVASSCPAPPLASGALPAQVHKQNDAEEVLASFGF
jgi:two-component system chemotaxis response regulator CheY